MTIGPRVRERRVALGLSQERLAAEAGLTWSAVQRLEAGKVADPHYSTLSGIAHVLGTTVAELVGEEEPALPLDEAPETGPSVPPLPKVSLAALSPEELEIRLFGKAAREGEELAPLLAVEAADQLVHDVRAERDDLENWLKAYAGAPSEEKMRARLDNTRAEASLAWARLYYLVLLDYWSKLADPRDVPFKGVRQIVSESEEAQGLMRAIKRYQDELRRLATGRAG